MAILHSPDSEYAKEMRRWNSTHTEFGPPGRPYQFHEYPTRMYKAGRTPEGKVKILEAETANDEHERERLERLGFTYGGQGCAIEAWEKQEAQFAQLAAEQNFTERRMSEKAQEQATAIKQAAGARHLPEIPETPVPGHRKKGWPKGKARTPKVAPAEEQTNG